MTLDYKKELEELISTVMAEDGSDLHLSEERQPVIRSAGSLIPLVKHPALTHIDIKAKLDLLLDDRKKEMFMQNKEVDFAYEHRAAVRFRGNAFYQLGKISIALRLIPQKIKTLEELHIPSI